MTPKLARTPPDGNDGHGGKPPGPGRDQDPDGESPGPVLYAITGWGRTARYCACAAAGPAATALAYWVIMRR
jgi:hypothetical protein